MQQKRKSRRGGGSLRGHRQCRKNGESCGLGDRRTSSKRENMSVVADSMPGKRVLSSRAIRKGMRRETRVYASGEEESG